MRLPFRAAGFVALAVAGITCSESPTAPASSEGSSVPVRVSMAPQFSPSAARAYGALSAAGILVTEAHVVLTAADGSTRDTVIAFPAGQDTLHIEIDVPPSGNNQTYTGLIELRTSNHTVLFSATVVVIARSKFLASLFPPVVAVINYSGPGRNTKAVAVAPPDTTVTGSPTLSYVATAIDSAGKAIPNLLVAWTSSDPTVATVTSTGDATASVHALGKRGTTTISASTPLGVTGSSKLSVVPPATHLVAISGGGQTGTAGSALVQPFVVEAQAADNLPVPGTSITFRAVTTGGGVAQTTARSADALGRASMVLTLGKTAGTYQYEAASPTLSPITVTETATPAPAAAIAIVSGDAQTDSTGRTLAQPLVVMVTDQFGGPASGATVNWTKLSGSGTVGAPSTPTAADGTTSTTYTLGGVVGPDVVRASLPGINGAAGSVQFTENTISRGAGAIAIISGGGQSGTPGTVLPTPIVARLTDVNGNPTPNQQVTWTASPNGATFNPVSSTTSATGTASTIVTLGSAAGPVTIFASSGALTASASATITVSAPASITKIAGDLQSATVGTSVSVAPSVVVKDAAGNPVPNAAVVFAVTAGGGCATGLNTTTNASGIATVGSWTLGAVAGPNTLTATTGSLNTTFSATGAPGSGSVLSFATAPSSSAVNGVALVVQPVIQLQDAQGNNVSTSGVVITASIASGSGSLTNATATTQSNGSATFSGLAISGTAGTFTLSFTASGYVPLSSGAIAVSAGAPSTITLSAGNNQTAPVGTNVPVPPAVLVTDASSNPVSGVAVTFGVVTAGAQISNASTSGTTLNVTTNASGIAALTAWTLGATAQQYVVNATVTGLTGSPVVFTATATPGNGTQLAFTTTPSPSATSGVALTQQPVVQLKDGQGNNVTTAGVVITASISSGSGTLANASATTQSGGAATFSGLAISGTAGPFTLSFASPGYTALSSGTITLSAGPANTLALVGGNNQTATVGTPVAIAPSVIVTDNAGNPVAGTVVTFNAVTAGSSISNASTSGTTLTVTTNTSGIAALTSWTMGTVPQSYTLTASALVVTGSPVTFTATGIPGNGTQLAFVTAPPASAASGVALSPQPVVQLEDALGNPVTTAGVTVTASITSGTGTLVSASAVTTSAGRATFSGLTINGTAGNFTLQFNASGYAPLSSGPIALGAGAAAKLGFASPWTPAAQPSQGGFVPQPTLQLLDANSNPVAQAGVTIQAIVASGPSVPAPVLSNSVALTNAGGVATFSGLSLGGAVGTYTLSFSTSGLTPVTSGNLTVLNGSAATLAINGGNNQSATVGNAVAIPPSVLLTDAFGNPVPSQAVTFTVVTAGALVSNGSTSGTTVNVTTNASGIAALTSWTLGGIPQTYTMTASFAALTPVTFTATGTTGSASTITLNAGNNQTTTVATSVAIAPSVKVTDANNNPVAGTVVQFTAVTAGSTVSNGTTTASGVTVTTNASGLAQLTAWTLGTVAGPYTMTATVSGLSGSPVTFSATGTPGPGSVLLFTQQPSASATSGSALPVQPIIQLKDSFGNSVGTANVLITATISSGSGSLTNATALTNASGAATFSGLTITGSAGNFTLQFGASGFSNLPFGPIAVRAGTATNIALFAGNNQSAPSGTAVAIPPAVRVTDVSGSPVAGTVVTFTVVTGGGIVQNSSTSGAAVQVTTNSSGVASLVAFFVGSIAGPNTLTADATGLIGNPVTFTETALAGPATHLVYTTTPSNTEQNGVPLAIQPAVQLKDGANNSVPAQGVVVTATITSGNGTLSNATATTNANGLATFSGLTITGTAGAFTLAFNVPGLTGLTASVLVSVGPATNMAVSAGNNQSTSASTAVPIPPAVLVTDASGNPVPGIVVTFTAVTSGGIVQNSSTSGTSVPVTTNSSGIAALVSFTVGPTAPQAYVLTATVSGLNGSPVTFTENAVPGPATHMVYVVSPSSTAQSGVPLAAQPQVKLLDAANNAVPTAGVQVTAFTTNTAGFLSNATATTNNTGVATFTALTISGLIGNYPLQMNSAGLTSLTGASVVLSAGPASSVSLLVQPPATAIDGVNFPANASPVVQVRDAQNNVVPGQQVVVSVFSGNGALGGTTTQTTNATGQATFGGLSITGIVGPYRLQFTAGAATTTSSTVTLNVGAPVNIAVNSGAGQSATVGEPVPVAPSALVTDVGGNPVSGASVFFNTSPAGSQIQDGNTCCNNLTVATNAAGVAPLISWTLANSIQKDTITATLSANGNFFRVIADGVARNGNAMSFTTQPPTTANSGVVFAPQPVIQLRAPSGAPLAQAGVPITAFITSGNGVLSGTATVNTNASGVASFSGLAITGSARQVTLRFGSPGFTGLFFNINVQ